MNTQTTKALGVVIVLGLGLLVGWLVISDLTAESPSERGLREGAEDFNAAMEKAQDCADEGGVMVSIDGERVCLN